MPVFNRISRGIGAWVMLDGCWGTGEAKVLSTRRRAECELLFFHHDRSFRANRRHASVTQRMNSHSRFFQLSGISVRSPSPSR
jgi:hypothetical protein